MRIGPIPTMNKWFSIHTREWERRGHLRLEKVHSGIYWGHHFFHGGVEGRGWWQISEGSKYGFFNVPPLVSVVIQTLKSRMWVNWYQVTQCVQGISLHRLHSGGGVFHCLVHEVTCRWGRGSLLIGMDSFPCSSIRLRPDRNDVGVSVWVAMIWPTYPPHSSRAFPLTHLWIFL